MILGALSEKLQSAIKKMRGYGTLTESNVSEALREVRLALLGADVHYQIARDFCDRVKAKALGEEVKGTIRPGDLFIKIVHDELLSLFNEGDRNLKSERPLSIVLCGLNGAGKTTTAAKLALHLKRKKEKVILVAADLARPAAIEQLQALGKQIEVPVLAPEAGQTILEHVKSAQLKGKTEAASVVIYDTAGRLEVDQALLDELRQVISIISPDETLLVADAATGQAAVEVAKAFSSVAPLTGIVLSKFDSDAKGGAALSLQSVTHCPIKFLGTGEQTNMLEVFDPERLVGRMLGMGDIVGLVESAQEAISAKEAETFARKLADNSFTLQDFLDQMRMIKRMGPLKNLLGMIPGMSSIPSSAFDERSMKHTEAMILSMTLQERKNPSVLNARRRLRIANGSGTTVAQVNDLVHRFESVKKMIQQFTRGAKNSKGGRGGMRSGKGVGPQMNQFKGLLSKFGLGD